MSWIPGKLRCLAGIRCVISAPGVSVLTLASAKNPGWDEERVFCWSWWHGWGIVFSWPKKKRPSFISHQWISKQMPECVRRFKQTLSGSQNRDKLWPDFSFNLPTSIGAQEWASSEMFTVVFAAFGSTDKKKKHVAVWVNSELLRCNIRRT